MECTTYDVHAYATNSEGTTYGGETSFITEDEILPVPDAGILPDVTGEGEITSLTAPTATNNCAGSITGTHDANLPLATQANYTSDQDHRCDK